MLILQIERKTNEFEAFPTSSLEVEIENPSPSIVVVRVSGEAGPEQADYLARQLESATKQAPCFVILDLARLNFLSSAALGCLIKFRRKQCWRGNEVWLTGLKPAVWLALHAAGLDGRFPIRDSVAQVFACSRTPDRPPPRERPRS
jgi:anti-anti-sigma factor